MELQILNLLLIAVKQILQAVGDAIQIHRLVTHHEDFGSTVISSNYQIGSSRVEDVINRLADLVVTHLGFNEHRVKGSRRHDLACIKLIR